MLRFSSYIHCKFCCGCCQSDFLTNQSGYLIVRFQNGSNKVVYEVLMQSWSKIILVISIRTRAARSFDFEITSIVSDQVALFSVKLQLFMHDSGSLAQGLSCTDHFLSQLSF